MKLAVCVLAVVIAGWCFGPVRASASGGGIDPVFHPPKRHSSNHRIRSRNRPGI
jgi:hypothetical protein